ncbi:MAG: hypothetical protein KME46_25985 [Brasilonema angustatum HA4187-MV1]|jgi:hypothetical protein|nr:hypothetical protein [Brasilonema angustatum HA4187-MV1]
MAIKGLTDKQARFPKIGTIRKGSPKHEGKMGRDLTYFRFDTQDSDAAQAFLQAYGKEPREINVMLPYQQTEQVFPSWMEEWAASSLIRRCDGEQQCLYLNSDRKSYSKKPIQCAAPQCNCKPVGRLTVVIPELRRLGYVEVLTHSKFDILGLTENLVAIEQASGDLRGIPFVLSRTRRSISVPMGEKRVRQDKWLLSIEASPEWSHRMIQQLEAKSMPRVLHEENEPALIQRVPDYTDRSTKQGLAHFLGDNASPALQGSDCKHEPNFKITDV